MSAIQLAQARRRGGGRAGCVGAATGAAATLAGATARVRWWSLRQGPSAVEGMKRVVGAALREPECAPEFGDVLGPRFGFTASAESIARRNVSL